MKSNRESIFCRPKLVLSLLVFMLLISSLKAQDKTENKFGSIIHSYTMQQAVEDKTVTPLLYEERIAELNVNDDVIDAWFARITEKLTEKQRTDLKKKF